MQVPSPSDDSVGSGCKHCGAAIAPTSKFCPNCGATQTSQPVNTAAPSMPSEEPSLKPEATALTSDDEGLHQPSKPRSIASHRLFWLGLAVMVIALASVGSWAWVAKHPITAKAQYALAEKYEKGDGVPQDYSQAAFWYRKAAEQGDDDAQKRLDELPIPQPLSQETISKVTGITNDISHADWTQILDLPQVSKAAARLFGSQLLYLRKAGHGSAEIADGLLIAQGCIPHFCPNGGVLTIDVKTGATAGGLADETGVTVYTGDYTRDKLPTVLKQWLESKNNLSIQYKDAQTPASVPAIQAHQDKPKDEWGEATPTMRRSMLATRVRSIWQNVAVENQGAVMTITHPGMDEESAHKIINDIGALAREAGLRRINFVSAGGMCQVTYTYPYCEYSCSDQGYCLASESHPCLDCCLAHGYPISQIPATRQEACPTHTWVYDVPPV